MRFLQDWKTILLRVQYLGFPRKWASVKAWARHTWYYKDPDAFFCMCAFSLEVARAFFPWNGSFSLKQRKIIAFQKPAEILHKWILQVYIRTIVLCSSIGAIKNQESSKVSMAPTSSSGRMTVVGMLLAGSNMHQSSSRSTTRDVRLATTLRCGFKVCMFFSRSKIRTKCTRYLCTPTAKHLLSSRRFPACRW